MGNSIPPIQLGEKSAYYNQASRIIPDKLENMMPHTTCLIALKQKIQTIISEHRNEEHDEGADELKVMMDQEHRPGFIRNNQQLMGISSVTGLLSGAGIGTTLFFSAATGGLGIFIIPATAIGCALLGAVAGAAYDILAHASSGSNIDNPENMSSDKAIVVYNSTATVQRKLGTAKKSVPVAASSSTASREIPTDEKPVKSCRNDEFSQPESLVTNRCMR